MNAPTTLLFALTLDQLLDELPTGVHPVVLIGRWFVVGERLAPERAVPRLAWGAGWLTGGMVLGGALASLVPRQPLVQGALASTLLAYRGLDRAVGEVQAALERDDLVEARRLLGWHLVSRPTDDLSKAEISAAAIESLAENLSDSMMAPLWWYLLGGLPGLVVYRVCNTADSMWGYRNERYEYLGKAAARCDDLLNIAPARLTAVLIALAAQVTNGRGAVALRVAMRDQGRTASPNASWPMATMAGALDTTLTKRDHYSLGDGSQTPDVVMLAEARRIVRRAVGLTVGVLFTGNTILKQIKKEQHWKVSIHL
ncbi:MAG: Adenosylcobinamide-phosphate synthase [Chloroflexi bacterium AL-W]|nr:Adenosylcobinamide-phosphate synthase [Chloroflexi bacterium AL-N1]NOK71521.1 Adenosylcobinamide-phosphate synthase [Chloroflexi bacterium AL-N10]NOK78867.1 Adenosylcobinamide-phosphate synthase [Chloroflexi bacterium AL-N5]NOK86343.1 Adenosylcobinamide-phosphate synthase [Chloroflexi bacterium AL-W]NOK93312.1 Adenosylcobinamide-phosphate synthase [Chloroflexi bacterium AL-N15]